MTPHDLIDAFDVVAEAPDGVVRLQELVLQLAVRGRLVPQDPADEPASVLLERIAAEKARLVKAGEIRRLSTLSPVNGDEVPFELPSGWSLVRFCDVFLTFLTGPFGTSLKKAEYESGGTPVINPQNLRAGAIIPSPETCVGEATLRRLKSFRMREGDVVVARRGEMGRCAVVGRSEGGWLCGTGSLVLRPPIDIDAHFVTLFLRSPWTVSRLSDDSVGATMRNLNQRIMVNLPFGLPPLAEQHRIVARVDELMGLLDRLEAARTDRNATRAAVRDSALAALQEADETDDLEVAWDRFAGRLDDVLCEPADIAPLRQTVLQLAVRGRLVPQDPAEEAASVLLERITAEKARLVKARKIPKQEPLSPVREDMVPFAVPKGWEWTRLADLSALVTDGVHKTPNYVSDGVPFLSIKDISGGFIDFSDTRFITKSEHAEINKRCNPEKGDILFCRIGTLGKAVVVDTEKPFSLFVSVGLIKLTRQLNPRFLCMALNSPATYLQYDRIKAGGSHTEKLNLGPMRALILPLPPVAEQHRIAAKVGELMGLLDRLEARLTAVQTAHAALAAAAVHHLDV
jgi:type I restriction enzyme S subunit